MNKKQIKFLLICGSVLLLLAIIYNTLNSVVLPPHEQEKMTSQHLNPHIRFQFEDLAHRYPDAFINAYGEPPLAIPHDKAELEQIEQWWNDKCTEALQQGQAIYLSEGCWKCHQRQPREKQSQVVTETSTSRRTGPDLTFIGGRLGNDWHAVHFFRPSALVTNSSMPGYLGFFDGHPDKPNERGLAIITYMQWQGSWHADYPYYENDTPVKSSQ